MNNSDAIKPSNHKSIFHNNKTIVLGEENQKNLNKFLKHTKKFDKETILVTLLEQSNINLIIDYVDFVIQNNLDVASVIHCPSFNKVFKIYLLNSDKTALLVINKYIELLDSDLLNFILEYYLRKDKKVFVTLITNKVTFNRIVSKIDIKYIEALKKHIFDLVSNNDYKEASIILNFLINEKMVDSTYVKDVEKSIIDISKKDHTYNSFVIGYYNSNKSRECFEDKMLNDIFSTVASLDTYKIVKMLLDENKFYWALNAVNKLKPSLDTNDIQGYIKLLKLPIPIACLLEKEPYLDKRIVLNALLKDETKLYVYGKSILSGYNFDDHNRNRKLDMEYLNIVKLNHKVSKYKIEENAKTMRVTINKVNNYNEFFRKYV